MPDLIRIIICKILFGKEDGMEMIAMLWAQKIMYGTKTYDQVPRLLKDQVKEVLIESGCEELIIKEE